MRAAQVKYLESVRPDGSLFVERPTHGMVMNSPRDFQIARDIQFIGYSAWEASSWLQELAKRHNSTATQLARLVFDPDNNRKVDLQTERVERSEHAGRRTEYWTGKHMLPLPDDTPLSKLDHPIAEYFPVGKSHGFAKIEQQGYKSELRAARVAQRLARVGIYVCLHDLNVVPEKQGKGLGTALAYVGLADQPKHLKSSLYTAGNNEQMRAWAEKYGYHLTDEYDDKDQPAEHQIFGGLSVPMVRYEAPSVGGVVNQMEQAHPWLAKGAVESMADLEWDAQEADIISRNPIGG